MWRFFGIAGFLALGGTLLLTARSFDAMAEPSPPAPEQEEARKPSLETVDEEAQQRIEGQGDSLRIPGPHLVSQRSVRLDWVDGDADGISFAVEAKLYQRDPPARFFWVARVRETPSGAPIREWMFLDHEFAIVPGIYNFPFFYGWIPHDLDPGSYVLELTVDTLSDPFDLTSNWHDLRGFQVE